MQSLIFFGADQYSAVALSTILESKIPLLVSVVTDQGKPKGKERIVEDSPVDKLAKRHNLKVFYYPDFDQSLITKNTLGLCASFDHLIPTEIINLFGGNLFNLHPSLLPQYRNVSPVQYALALGDTVTGITLFRISAGIDNGEVISQAEEGIRSDDTTQTLTPRLFKLGTELFLSSSKNNFSPTGTLENGDTGKLIFTHRLTRDSGYLEWKVLQSLLTDKKVTASETKNELLQLRLTHNPSGNILADLLRALTPWPTVWSVVPSKKGELRVSLESVIPSITLKIAGKPKAISYVDFEKYYLS